MKRRLIRRMRKMIMKLGTITRVEVIDKDIDGNKLPKNQRGYVVEALVNGYKICAPDDSWYMAWKGCLEAAIWASEQEPYNRDKSKGD